MKLGVDNYLLKGPFADVSAINGNFSHVSARLEKILQAENIRTARVWPADPDNDAFNGHYVHLVLKMPDGRLEEIGFDKLELSKALRILDKDYRGNSKTRIAGQILHESNVYIEECEMTGGGYNVPVWLYTDRPEPVAS